jgi:Rieske Fe-S protein
VAAPPSDPRAPVDPAVVSPGREGLTGTAPASVYAALSPSEAISVAPDFRPAAEQPAWRQDFPIDWPEDHYVERRDFMKFLVLTSFAFAAGQLWIAGQNWLRARRGRLPIRHLTGAADLAVGGALVFSYPDADDPCVLVRVADNAFVAYGQKCTHLSCAVIPQPGNDVLICPCHNGIFDLPTGRPLAGPPRRPLDRVTLDVRNGEVYATGIEHRTA